VVGKGGRRRRKRRRRRKEEKRKQMKRGDSEERDLLEREAEWRRSSAGSSAGWIVGLESDERLKRGKEEQEGCG
jgi:hypothetical protein